MKRRQDSEPKLQRQGSGRLPRRVCPDLLHNGHTRPPR